MGDKQFRRSRQREVVKTDYEHFVPEFERPVRQNGKLRALFNMTVLNDPDRFYFVMGTIDRLPLTGDKGIILKQQLQDKLVEHKQYIDKHGQDMREIRSWKWGAANAGQPA